MRARCRPSHHDAQSAGCRGKTELRRKQIVTKIRSFGALD
jgi:hypothetical protein